MPSLIYGHTYKYTHMIFSSSTMQVEELQELVDKFRPLPNLLWGIWALIQSKYSTIEFDFLDYAVQRLEEYKRNAPSN